MHMISFLRMRKTAGNWYPNKILNSAQQYRKSVMEAEPAKDVGVQSDLPVFWSREATLALLSAYEMQKERLGKDFRFKNYMWVAISDALKKELGKNFTAAQCENRFRVLLRSYRKTIDKNLKSVRRRKDFQYYEQMQRIAKDEIKFKPVSLLRGAGACASDEKSDIQIEDVRSESEPTSVSKQLLSNSGKSNVSSDMVCNKPEQATSGSKQLFLIKGKATDGSNSEAQPSPNNNKNFFLISANPIVNSGGICNSNESESSRTSSKQLFIITGKPNVNSDSGGEPVLGADANKQLLIISGKPNLSNDRISCESEAAPNSGKQLFIIGGKSNLNNNRINSEPEHIPNSDKQLLIIGGKTSVNSDKITSVPEPTPTSSSESEQAANISKQSFINLSKSSLSPPEKRRKLKKVFLEQIRSDRKLHYEKRLALDKERLQGLEKRNDELLELKKMKLQQTERLIACEEEKLKCEKEKVTISREKLKIFGRLVELQEESNEILRSINDQLDFLL